MTVTLTTPQGQKITIPLSQKRFDEVVSMMQYGHVPIPMMGDIEKIATAMSMTLEEFLAPAGSPKHVTLKETDRRIMEA